MFDNLIIDRLQNSSIIPTGISKQREHPDTRPKHKNTIPIKKYKQIHSKAAALGLDTTFSSQSAELLILLSVYSLSYFKCMWVDVHTLPYRVACRLTLHAMDLHLLLS